MSITSTCLVEIDGNPLADDIASLLVSAYVDDSQQLPDTFVPAVPRSESDRAVQGGLQGRIDDQDQRQVADAPQPEPLISGEITALEAGVRHRRHVHCDQGI